MPTVPNIGSMTEQTKNPLAQPSPSDLLMAAASMPTQSDVAKRKLKGKGK